MANKITFDCNVHLTGSFIIHDGPPMPGPLSITLIQEDSDVLIYQINLPQPGATDVVKRELTIATPDQPDSVMELAPDLLAVEGQKGPQDAKIKLTLVDIDDAGNRSEPRIQEFTLTDTIAPPEPGEIGIAVTGEE
jgi:hypothetical protein